MSKNIVVCCDGTANEFSEDLTNVVKLFYTLVQDPARQLAFYHPGVGTMEPPGALSPLRKRIGMVLGQAVGAGIESDIRDAYVYLMRYFEPGDRLFVLLRVWSEAHTRCAHSRRYYTCTDLCDLATSHWSRMPSAC